MHDAAEAQVETVASQGVQACGEAMDLEVAVQRLLAVAAGLSARGIPLARQLGDRLREALRDRREVPLIASDQGGVGLGGQARRKIEDTHGRSVCAEEGALRQAPTRAIS